MKAVIHPSRISGAINASPSKSMMQRALAASLLRKGKTIIHRPGYSKDDQAALSVIRNLGAKADFVADTIVITSAGVLPFYDEIHCGESGLCVRMFTPIAALSEKNISIHGEGSLLNRSMKVFDEIMPQLSVDIVSNNGKLPLKVKGPIVPNNISIDGSSGSQFLTGLLMAFSSIDLEETVIIVVENLKSKPYLDLTLSVIESFGLNLPVNDNYLSFTFAPFKQKVNTSIFEYEIESDWSSASFLLVAAAIAGNIKLTGINTRSNQADNAIVEVLQLCGAEVSISETHVEVSRSSFMPFEFDATDCPDLFPPLVALASYCNGTSIIKGVKRLSDKESDRGITLQHEFGKMGIEINLNGDEMQIVGGTGLNGAVLNSHNDHRIAMAAAIAALGANEEVIIESVECVSKSYPDFFKDLASIGASIKMYNVNE